MENRPPMTREWPEATTPAVINNDGQTVIQVPNKQVARLLQLGISVERKQKERNAQRKAAKDSRRRNRSK